MIILVSAKEPNAKPKERVMATSLTMVACQNCHLLTRADRKMCTNDGPPYGPHFRDERQTPADRKPTAEDLEAYYLWLSQRGETLVPN